VDCGVPILDDLSKAKLVWTSEAAFPPMAGTRHVFKEDDEFFYFGGYGDPVVAGGKVYVQYYRPSGPIDWAGVEAWQKRKGMVDPATIADERGRQRAERRLVYFKRYVPESYRVAADDVLVCLDAATGKTLWKREFIGTGFNYSLPEDEAYSIHAIPCVGDGRVYILGSGAVVYAVDAESGKPLWQTPVGPAAENMARWVARYRETGRITRHPSELKKTLCQTIVYAGGVVARSDAIGAARDRGGGPARGGPHCGMVGFAAATGKRLWTAPDCIANYNAPLPWEHDGKTYFIGCNLSNIKCVEAVSGKVLWTLASTDDHMVHNGGMQGAIDGDLLLVEDAVDVTGDRKRSGNVGLSCYRLTLVGPQKLWRFGCGGTIGIGANDKTGMSPLIHRGYAYFQMPSRPKRAWCIDMRTGQSVAVVNGSAGMRYGNTVGVGDTILTPRGLFGTGKDFRALSGGGRETVRCTAYSGPSVAGGRLYTRDNQRVYCYHIGSRDNE
jgi:outer membrane protein assembly factor BamB